jgi:uncharacterized membrane protein YdfJ with MMPL/SSD domain
MLRRVTSDSSSNDGSAKKWTPLQSHVPARSAFSAKYTRFLVKWRRACLAFWFVMCVLGVTFGLKFLSNTTQDFNPPPSTGSAIARVALGSSFPELDNTGAIIVVVEATSCDNDMAVFPECLVGSVDINATLVQLNTDIIAWGAANGVAHGRSFLLNATAPTTSYFTLVAQQLQLLAGKLVSSTDATAAATGRPPRNVTILNIPLHEDDEFQNIRKNFVNWLHSRLARYQGGAALSLAATGQDVFAVDVAAKAISDISLHDGIVLPLAILVLGTIVKSARLMIIPICLVIVSFLCSFLIMYPVSLNMNVITFCPSIMMSATIALSIDYSLFLLSRFAEERQPPKSRSMRDAIQIMMKSAGHTVSVSGSTLTLCFLGLCAFPLDLMQSLGLGAAVSIVCTMGVNLNLGPCLLLTFPTFFGSRNPCCCRLPQWWPACLGGGGSGGDDFASPLLVGNSDSDEDRPLDDDDEGEEESMSASIWYKVGKICLGLGEWHTLVPVGVLLACLALVVPFSFRAFDFTASIELSLMLPRGSSSADAFVTMQDSFGDGTVFPYQLLVRPKEPLNCAPTSQTLFQDVNTLVGRDMAAVPNTNITGFSGASFLGVSLKSALESKAAQVLQQGLDLLANESAAFPKFPKLAQEIACVDGTLASLRAEEPVLNTLYNRSWATWALGEGNCESITANSSAANSSAITEVVLAAQLTAILSDPFVLNATGYGCISTLINTLASLTKLRKIVGDPLLQPLGEYCRATKIFNSGYITDPTKIFNTTKIRPATYLDVRLDIDPYSPMGVQWLKDTRAVLDNFTVNATTCPGGIELFLSGSAALSEDAVTAVYGVFPYMISATLATSFLVVGISFRSIFVPLRAVVTICLTLLWVYGLAVMVYVDGAWDGLGIPGLSANVGPPGEINWFAPVMCFSILVGLGLDYDIFLLTRIVEFRDQGYTEKASIMMGLCKTGGIITAAGIIMAIAFSGLLFSSEMLLNQCSFYVSLASYGGACVGLPRAPASATAQHAHHPPLPLPSAACFRCFG